MIVTEYEINNCFPFVVRRINKSQNRLSFTRKRNRIFRKLGFRFWHVVPPETPRLTSNLEKVKQSRNRPGVAQRVSRGLGSQISMKFGT